jgi:hypothetical protein
LIKPIDPNRIGYDAGGECFAVRIFDHFSDQNEAFSLTIHRQSTARAAELRSKAFLCAFKLHKKVELAVRFGWVLTGREQGWKQISGQQIKYHYHLQRI